MNRGLRFFAATILAVPLFFSVGSVLMIPKFDTIFSEMVSGEPLPLITQILLSSYPFIVIIPLAVSAFAFLTLMMSRREEYPYYVAGSCFIFSIVIVVICWAGLYLPLISIVEKIGSF